MRVMKGMIITYNAPKNGTLEIKKGTTAPYSDKRLPIQREKPYYPSTPYLPVIILYVCTPNSWK
ncbi:MAG: hypothetical protein SPI35_04545 [Porphyromonas sp.]|nr:hypothetical protein [Porphyromonas sp.]